MLKRWRSIGIAAVIGCVAAVSGVAVAANAPIDAIEKQFRELPMEARQWTGPLFWLHGEESKERLEMYVGKVAEGGNGSFTTESRPHKDWLGEGWWRDLGICLDAAKKNDLKMWIFDEKWWPSGEVAGKVPAEHASRRLVTTAVDVNGPAPYTAKGFGGQDFVAVVAGVVAGDAIDGSTLVDLSGSIHDRTLTWNAPAGKWKVMKFTWVRVPVDKRYLVDGASAESVDWYIRTVYQPHYDHFKDDFGKTIRGFFYDEPETHGDWGTEVMKLLAERGVDWKKALVAFKYKLVGEEQIAARYQYLDAFAEAWGRTMYGGISRWCREKGVQSIGHFLEHANAYVSQLTCAGNMFQLQKYSDMGAIDAVFDQFRIGQRVARDAPCWQTPKLGSSISHAYGKPDDITMVEIFGARGQDLTYPEMKWWADHMHVSGVNFLIPHSFNPRSPRDTDCPPYFYNGGFEPRWPLYRVFADYTSRLTVMLKGGRHVCPVALLFLGQSAHAGKFVLPDQISEALQDALFDCDWMPYDVFEDTTELAGKEIKLRAESYKVLVVPPVEVIPYGVLAKAKAFFDAGGVVVGYGFLPSRSATLGKTSADISALRDAVWGGAKTGLDICEVSPAGGRSYLLPEKPTPEQLQQVLTGDAGIHPTLEVLEGKTDHWLHVLHRVLAGCDVFFITNQNHLGDARRFRFRVTANGEPECWDAMRNEITAVPYQHAREVQVSEVPGTTTLQVSYSETSRLRDLANLSLTLEPSESVLLVFRPKKRPLPTRLDDAGPNAVSTIAITRDAAPTSNVASGQGAASAVSAPQAPKGAPLTPSPVKADPFVGHCEIPMGAAIADSRVFLEMDSIAPEAAARVTINGEDAGGFIGKPLRLEVTKHLQAGTNTFRVEPFTPSNPRLVFYGR